MALDSSKKTYIPLIVAYNWSCVIMYGLALVTTLLYPSDNSLGPSLSLAFRIVSALYRWFVAKWRSMRAWLIPLVVMVMDEVLGRFLGAA